ncbi:MAG: hypothetical protein ACP5RP_03275 [Candidatus Micrarchaeia archaeon]
MQSAMEYLLTYGWAIIIIAATLGILFYLGVFNNSAFIEPVCIGNSGFYCSAPALSLNGIIKTTIAQTAMSQINNVKVFFVPTGASFSDSLPNYNIGNLSRGQEVNVTIPINSSSNTIYPFGTEITGNLYLEFTGPSGIRESEEVATLIAKVNTAYIYMPQQTTSTTTIIYNLNYNGTYCPGYDCSVSIPNAVPAGSGNNNFYVLGADEYDYQPWDGVLNWPIFVMDDWTGMGIQGGPATVTKGTESNTNVYSFVMAGANIYSNGGWQNFVEQGNGTYGWPGNSDCVPYTATYSYSFNNWNKGTPIAVLIMESWGWWPQTASYTTPPGCTVLYSFIGGGASPGAVIMKCNQFAGTTYSVSASFTCHAQWGYIAVAFPNGTWS